MMKLLVIGPAWVGDMVLAHSAIQQLKQRHPNSQIDVAAPPWTLPLLSRMPEVHQAIPLPFKHGELALAARWRLGRQLASHGYQQAILFTNNLKSAILPWAANIPIRTGFKGEMRYGLVNDMRPLDTAILKQTVERFVSLCLPVNAALPNPLPPPQLLADPARAAQWCAAQHIHLNTQPILGLCPGAEYGEAKRWPASHYAEVALAAIARGWQVWLFGASKDQAVTAEIQHLTKQACVDLAGRTQLTEAVDLMSLCHSVISNDSGLMHIAAALNKPVIAIYGSSNPSHTPPMSPRAVIEYLALPCSPCFERRCPLNHLNCLTQITPARVMADWEKQHVQP